MAVATKTRILILGGGYAGLYTALGLQRHKGDLPLDVTVVDRNPYMTYQPLLPEVAGGHVAPNDVTIELRRVLKRARVIQGDVTGIDVEGKDVTVATKGGADIHLAYDHVVIAMGAVTRVFPTPGLEEHGIGFKTVEEAVGVRNQVLERVEFASSTTDAAARRKALTFVFIGGGYTGVEAMGELNNLSKRAVKVTPNLDESDLRWVLVEALDRVAPEVGPELSEWTLGQLRERGIDVRLKTTMKSCVDGTVVLSTDEEIPADTIVWTAGVKPAPVLADTDVPLGPKGHASANAKLQIIRDDGTPIPGVWAAGDNAQIPDLTAEKQPAYYPPNAQNALRQAWRLATNIVAAERGAPIEEYRHASLGTVAGYGVGRGAANIKGIRMKNVPAWLTHRAYHGAVIPTVNRKIRVIGGWLIEAMARSETSSLITVEKPTGSFRESFGAAKKDAAAAKK